jgi:hypothetical protein
LQKKENIEGLRQRFNALNAEAKAYRAENAQLKKVKHENVQKINDLKVRKSNIETKINLFSMVIVQSPRRLNAETDQTEKRIKDVCVAFCIFNESIEHL